MSNGVLKISTGILLCLFAVFGNTKDIVAEESATGYPAYDEILQSYYEGAIQNWDIQEFQENDLCYLAGYTPDINKLGYCLMDVDQDGTEELLTGTIMEDDYPNEMFFDLYTIQNGNIVRVVTSGERDRYYVCENGMIANEGSSSAMNSCWNYYDYAQGKLTIKESVFFDGYYDSENPYFYTTGESHDDYSCPISEESADAIIDQYTYKDLPFIPLSELSERNATVNGETGEMSVLRQKAEAEVTEVEQQDEVLQSELNDTADVQEEAYCQNLTRRYQLWDGELNALWSYLQDTLSENEMDVLMQEEVAWINEKEAAVNSAVSEAEGLNSAIDFTIERVYYLLSRIS